MDTHVAHGWALTCAISVAGLGLAAGLALTPEPVPVVPFAPVAVEQVEPGTSVDGPVWVPDPVGWAPCPVHGMHRAQCDS